MDENEGRWVTIHGKRVFIKDKNAKKKQEIADKVWNKEKWEEEEAKRKANRKYGSKYTNEFDFEFISQHKVVGKYENYLETYWKAGNTEEDKTATYINHRTDRNYFERNDYNDTWETKTTKHYPSLKEAMEDKYSKDTINKIDGNLIKSKDGNKDVWRVKGKNNGEYHTFKRKKDAIEYILFYKDK